jgi:outer membrane protein OmpA-like peptidoglycan-associated protein
MVIKIESHTDSRGPSKYNDVLSEERAKATYNYLINKGVDPDRITEYKGYGEQKLTNQCNGTIPCTEAQHQLNRRTQFIIIKMQ